MHLLTVKGKTKLVEKQQELEKRLKFVLSQKGEAAEIGGNVWHDNFAFEQLQRDEAMLQHQIQQLRTVIDTGRLAPKPSTCEQVEIGCRISIEYEDGHEDTLTIGGYMESDPANKIISYDAPLAKGVLGAATGETRGFTVGQKKREVTITKIEISEKS